MIPPQCVDFTVLYLRNRLLGRTMGDFINFFNTFNLEDNDAIVCDVISNAHSQCVKTDVYLNQTCCSLV